MQSFDELLEISTAIHGHLCAGQVIAQSLLAAGRFEEAAAAFATLESTSVAEQARLGRERAVELYVQQVREDGAVLFDFNHPLAGQPVTFEVQLIGVL